jgi:predicted  nucleic acid-binding Zn-ribbon protein
MSNVADLDRLIRAIKDAEIRLSSIKTSVENIDKEILALTPRKAELATNLRFLKQGNTVPLAQEYKRTKAELTKTSSRLNIISGERVKAHQACLEIEKIIEKFKKDHTNLIISSENNILKGNFGGTRGKR